MPSGKLPGSNSPAVPFSEPTNQVMAPTTANTNFGRDVNTLDRSMPVGMYGSDEAEPGPPFGDGVCKPEWGKRK